MNGPNKLNSYITLGLKGLPGTNTLAYRVPLESYEENKALKIQRALGTSFTTLIFS
jgi:hypothetical protein